MGGAVPDLLPGYRVKVLDGNHLGKTQRRLKPLRDVIAGPLPGQTRVVLDPALGSAIDVVPCEDGHAQERSLLDTILETVAENDVWVGGSAGTILHYDGSTWQQLDAGVAERYRRTWATGPNDVWFVGTNAIVTRWNGVRFSTDYCPVCGEIWGVWGRGPNDMWLTDRSSQLVHWDGGSFETVTVPSGVVENIEGNGLFGAGDNDLFLTAAFADGGYGVLHYRR